MITRVKHLQESLQRFNPEARLEYELDVQGISPATQCTIVPIKLGGADADSIIEERDELDARCDELLDGLKAISAEVKNEKPDIKTIKNEIKKLNLE